MNFPISIISHSSTIPANSPDYVEKFEKIEFPNRDLFTLSVVLPPAPSFFRYSANVVILR